MPSEYYVKQGGIIHKKFYALPEIEKIQPYLSLNDGNKIPMVGLGTWSTDGKELKEAIKIAIQCGYRHIDTAANYKNESAVGQAISECIMDEMISRQDIFVTTKLWNNSHSRGSVPVALKKSLEALNLDYVDLYLIHYPIGYKEGGELSPTDANGKVITSDVDYVETWKGMEDVKLSGLTKSIGVSNFNRQQISRILSSCRIVPAMNQVECHPYLNQGELLEYCRSHGIELTAYSPLGSPGKSDLSKQPCLIEDPLVKSLAAKYMRSPAQILMRFHIDRGVVVIPKALSKAHIESNLKAVDFSLTSDDMAQLDSMNRNYRYMRFERCLNHKYYPFEKVENV